MYDSTYPAPQPPRRKVWPWVVGGLVVALLAVCGIGVAMLGAGGAAISAIDTQVSKEASDRLQDVAITKCELDSTIGLVTVSYTIKNTDTAMRSYTIELDVVGDDKDMRIGTAMGFEPDVKPGATVKGEAIGNVTGKPKTLTCVLTGA